MPENPRSYALTDLGRAATDPAPGERRWPTDRPNPLGPPAVVRCLGCRDRDGQPRTLADCTCLDHLLPVRSAP